MDILRIPLGWILKIIYMVVQNYGFALIIFTIIAKMLMMPLTFKQQKSMVQTNLLKPKLDALQKQYGDNKEKYSEEMMKLYKKHGVNPMSGCLPLLIQFPILFALYDVVRRPITYIWGQKEAITELFTKYGIDAATAKTTGEIELAKKLFVDGQAFGINFNFLGLDLSQTPSFDMSSPTLGMDWIWILPVVAGLTTWISTKLMNIGVDKPKDEKKSTRPPKPGEKDPSSTANTMTNIMPFMTAWFAFMVPAGISIYWIANNVIQVGQQYIINRHYVPKMKERMLQENEKIENNRKKRKNGRRGR